MDIGKKGVFLFTEGLDSRALRDTVQRIERLGYGAVWFPEAIGREPFATASFILSNTERLVAATGIVSIYSRDPMVTAMGQQTLTEQSGGRFLLGLGVSHSMFVEMRGHSYGKPLESMRGFVKALREAHAGVSILRNAVVEGFDEVPTIVRNATGVMSAEVGQMPVVLAALGPKMVALAGRIAQGAHPYNTTPGHTARAREILGPGPWLCPMQRVCLTRDASKARTVGRQLLGMYLQLPNYRNSLKDQGFSDTDLDNNGSDRLVDTLLGWGDEAGIAAHVQAHLDAGASHVCIQPISVDNPALPDMRALEILAPAS